MRWAERQRAGHSQLLSALLLIAMVFGVVSIPRAVAQETAAITIEPVALEVGQEAILEVRANCGPLRCAVFEVELILDPSIAVIQQVRMGNYLGADTYVVIEQLDRRSGTLAYAATVLGPTPADGGDVLFELLIQANGAGRTSVEFAHVAIGDLTPFNTDVRSGTLRVTAPTPTPEPTRDLRPAVANPSPVVDAFNPGSINRAIAYESVWADLEFQDIKEPGLVEYSIDVSARQRYRWVFVWCGDDQRHLESMLDVMSVGFFVDNTPVEDLHEYSTEARCRGWVTILTDWQPDETAVLEIRYRLESSVTTEDGTYRAGSYVQRIYAQAR
ncbi:MAG: hypothetical protein IPK19_34330 [Chloroflexi bacterium]|nr:hypothetical protein [Chloroflexota bacterium]